MAGWCCHISIDNGRKIIYFCQIAFERLLPHVHHRAKVVFSSLAMYLHDLRPLLARTDTFISDIIVIVALSSNTNL